MVCEPFDRKVFRLFAEILDYPQAGLVETVRACETLVPREARLLLDEFQTFAETVSLNRLEEIYVGIFDWNTTFSLYVGHHLFGESYKRSAFLMELKERYRAHGFGVEKEKELPDHVVVILRFLAVCDDTALVEELIQEALLPVLERMIGEREDPERSGKDVAQLEPDSSSHRGEQQTHPYSGVLQALQWVLQQQLQLIGSAPEGGTHHG
ncbi:MAG: nitrate reductase molybdenum cofactor assembly chaperone [Anaerolineae bacterium]